MPESVTHYYSTAGQINKNTPVLVAYDGSKVGGNTFTKVIFNTFSTEI